MSAIERGPYEQSLRTQAVATRRRLMGTRSPPVARQEPMAEPEPAPEPEVPSEAPPAVRDWLHVGNEKPSAKMPYTTGRWRIIADEVAEKHRLSVKDIFSGSRSRYVVNARQELCYRLTTETPLSTPTIGRLIGRDHSTVIHSAKRHAARMSLTVPPRPTSRTPIMVLFHGDVLPIAEVGRRLGIDRTQWRRRLREGRLERVT